MWRSSRHQSLQSMYLLVYTQRSGLDTKLQFRGPQNIEHKWLKGSFSRYYERVFKYSKIPANLPAKYREFRGIVSRKKIIPSAQAPEPETTLVLLLLLVLYLLISAKKTMMDKHTVQHMIKVIRLH